LNRAAIARLIVAGDLVESARPCHRTDQDVRRFRAWLLAQGVSLTLLAGNHDRAGSGRASQCTHGTDRASVGQAFQPDVRPESLTYSIQNSAVPLSGPEQTHPLPDCQTVADWTIGHGDLPLAGPRTISGHHHPALRIEGTTAPCFLVGPGRIILPAFSLNAAGCDLITAALPREWLRSGFHCVASTGVDLLDFGPLSNLRRLRAGARAGCRRRR
jgi:metallophosphoesterase superfamily enzyme